MLGLLLVLLSAEPAPPAGFDREAAMKRFAAMSLEPSEGDVWQLMWHGMGEKSPCEIVHAAKPVPTTFAGGVAALRAAWSVPEAAAAPILEAEVFLRGGGERNEETGPWLASRYQAAVKAAPASPAIVHAIGAAQGDGASIELLQQALATFPHPGAVAASLIRGTYPKVGAIGAMVALQDDPSTLTKVATAVAQRDLFPLSLKLQVLQFGFAHPPPALGLAPLAESVLSDALKQGLFEMALEIWNELPPPVRAGVHGLDLQLALAALEAGRAKEAAAFAPRVPEPKWPEVKEAGPGDRGCAEPVMQEALLRSRDPKRAAKDSFLLARGLSACYRGPRFARTFGGLLRVRHPDLAREYATYRPEREDWRESELTPAVLAFVRPARERLDAARQRQSKTAVALEAEWTAGAAAKADVDVVTRLLDVPPWSPWVEHPLPEGVKPAPEDRGEEPDVKLPRGYWPLRVERKKKSLWVVGASQNLDPAGEVSPGGFWLLHSENGGRDWDPPLYTGLRAMQPYVIPSRSALPLVKGDKVTLEVQVRELDPATISFPPVGLGFRRKAAGLYVEASLADLQKDSDKDGLTDLIEQRLLTDPKNADTDGDGLSDLEDSFPTVPLPKQEPPATADLITTVLEKLVDGPHPGANVVGQGKTLLEQAGGRPAPIAPDHVVFITGSRGTFVGVRALGRVIVLSDEESLRVSKERGLLYPLSLEVVVDEAGENAYVNWSEHWRGGSYEGKKENGRWVLKSTGEWIT